MDWDWIVSGNCERLKQILAVLVAMAGCDGRGQFTFFPLKGARPQDEALAEKSKLSPALVPTLARRLHRALLRQLRPLESAARRLVVMAARDLVVELPPERPRAPKPPRRASAFLRGRSGTGIILPHGMRRPDARETRPPGPCRLPLLDPLTRPGPPRPRPARAMPRITHFGPFASPPTPLRPPCLPGDPLDARTLLRRLSALSAVLDDLPGQTLRFARWRARTVRTRAMIAAGKGVRPGGVGRLWPFRPGRPPGQRAPQSRRDEIHEVLADLSYFAREALERPDSS